MASLAIILPAAGQSTRFGAGQNKLFALLRGPPVVAHTVEAFRLRSDVPLIVIATGDPAPLREHLARLDHLGSSKVVYALGGASRAQSVLSGLQAVPPEIEWVAIHDAARPLVSQALIDRTFAAAQQHGAAVPALPVALTIKAAQGPLPAPVERTVPRQSLWAMQTPQIMRRAALLKAFEECPLPLEQVTDDAQVLELAGQPVWLVPGEERNIKITTAFDLRVAELLLASP